MRYIPECICYGRSLPPPNIALGGAHLIPRIFQMLDHIGDDLQHRAGLRSHTRLPRSQNPKPLAQFPQLGALFLRATSVDVATDHQTFGIATQLQIDRIQPLTLQPSGIAGMGGGGWQGLGRQRGQA
jgi:hypothetical protein